MYLISLNKWNRPNRSASDKWSNFSVCVFRLYMSPSSPSCSSSRQTSSWPGKSQARQFLTASHSSSSGWLLLPGFPTSSSRQYIDDLGPVTHGQTVRPNTSLSSIRLRMDSQASDIKNLSLTASPYLSPRKRSCLPSPSLACALLVLVCLRLCAVYMLLLCRERLTSHLLVSEPHTERNNVPTWVLWCVLLSRLFDPLLVFVLLSACCLLLTSHCCLPDHKLCLPLDGALRVGIYHPIHLPALQPSSTSAPKSVDCKCVSSQRI